MTRSTKGQHPARGGLGASLSGAPAASRALSTALAAPTSVRYDRAPPRHDEAPASISSGGRILPSGAGPRRRTTGTTEGMRRRLLVLVGRARQAMAALREAEDHRRETLAAVGVARQDARKARDRFTRIAWVSRNAGSSPELEQAIATADTRVARAESELARAEGITAAASSRHQALADQVHGLWGVLGSGMALPGFGRSSSSIEAIEEALRDA